MLCTLIEYVIVLNCEKVIIRSKRKKPDAKEVCKHFIIIKMSLNSVSDASKLVTCPHVCNAFFLKERAFSKFKQDNRIRVEDLLSNVCMEFSALSPSLSAHVVGEGYRPW